MSDACDLVCVSNGQLQVLEQGGKSLNVQTLELFFRLWSQGSDHNPSQWSLTWRIVGHCPPCISSRVRIEAQSFFHRDY